MRRSQAVISPFKVASEALRKAFFTSLTPAEFGTNQPI